MRILFILAALLCANISYGNTYIGGTDANLSGTATLLLESGTRYAPRIRVPALGLNSTQKSMIGLYGAGSGTLAGLLHLDRDTTFFAPPGGTLKITSYVWGPSGSASSPIYSMNFGTGTNTGSVLAQGHSFNYIIPKGLNVVLATLSGSMTVDAGTFGIADPYTAVVSGTNHVTSPFTIKEGAQLIGAGNFSNPIVGGGAVSPGNVAVSSGTYDMMNFERGIDPSNGLAFNFKFSGSANTSHDYRNMGRPVINDTILLENTGTFSSISSTNTQINWYQGTGTTAFLSPLTSANNIGIYFPSEVAPGQSYSGGFFSYQDATKYPTFYDDIKDASYKYYVKDSGGTHNFNNSLYSVISNTLTVTPTISTIPSTQGPFGYGTITNGQVTTFNILAPIVSWLLLTACSVGLSYWLMNRNSPETYVAKSNINYSRSRPSKVNYVSANTRVVKYRPYSPIKSPTNLGAKSEKYNLPIIQPLMLTDAKTQSKKEA